MHDSIEIDSIQYGNRARYAAQELAQVKLVRKKQAVASTGKKAAVGRRSASKPATARKHKTSTKQTGEAKLPIVGIGASAGGLEAFEAFFTAMAPDSGLAFVLVAHLDPSHVSLLPELVRKWTQMPVRQIVDGLQVEPNSVYVIPPNRDLRILHGALQLLERPQRRGINLPIDSFFRSLAQDQGGNAIGIVLSGTGTDGSIGLKAIKGEAGMTMAQDQESASYDGMPRSAIATRLVDFILPPDKMPAQLLKYTHSGQHNLTSSGDQVQRGFANELQKIFIILRSRTNHDFSLYKQNTICRRIERRMNLHQLNDISGYVRYLQESEREVHSLFRELLIGVTSFFRDPKSFKTLETEVLPTLIGGKPEGYQLRIWVPGCSSGEEAYSIAILLTEYLQQHPRSIDVRIFGTDIDEKAIAVARIGRYPPSIAADLGEERLKRNFVKQDDGQYLARKSVREMLIFAPQNLIKDPPFTKLDLLCCRNLLIYLGPELQRKLLPLFHYSLKPGGFLFLGSSETIGQATDLFTPIDRKWKIFQRLPSVGAARPALILPTGLRECDDEIRTTDGTLIDRTDELSTVRLIDTILRETDTPPCAIIDNDCNIVYIHGQTGRYLELAEGRTSVNILEMAKPGLKSELATAVQQVSIHNTQVTREHLQVACDGSHLRVNLTVKPVLSQSIARGLMMVLFQEAVPAAQTLKAKVPSESKPSRSVEELEYALQQTREGLQTTIEELETSNEELKSANEELQSTNEELQSTNEELETSKEELQSLNEESVTVNSELQNRIDELASTNDDIKNLLDSTGIATVFLDADLRIRRFTPPTTEIISLAGTDIGRPLAHFATDLAGVDLPYEANKVLEDLATRTFDSRSKTGQQFEIRLRPYRTVSNMIDGVVITFDDITERKNQESQLKRAKIYAESIVNTLREPLAVLDEKLHVLSASNAFYDAFYTSKTDTVGKPLYELGNNQWDIPELRTLLEKILPANTSVEAFKVDHDFPDIGRRSMLLNARRMVSDGEQTRILLAIQDVTEQQET